MINIRNPKNPKNQKIKRGAVLMQTYVKEFTSHPMIRFILLLAAVSTVASAVTFSGWKTAAAFALGVLIYAVAEYVVHRYILHEFPRLIPVMYKGHAKHHEHPTEFAYLFSPLWYDVAVYAVYAAVLWAVLRDFRLVVAVIAGTSVYQVYYQWMHYVSHRPIKPLTRFGRWMKKKHLLHHYKDEHTWYGVSHPTMDYLMGTHRSASDSSSGRTDASV